LNALRSHHSPTLRGTVRTPGDKSISHRALILGALAVGTTTVHGLLEGDDVLATAAALRQMGAQITSDGNGTWRIDGLGVGGLREPEGVLDLGNSGTGVRLLMGAVATHPFTSFFTGDASLRRRPMERIVRPIEAIGACVRARSVGCLPLSVEGTSDGVPIEYAPPAASAQVKSAILLAGLNVPGTTRVIEATPTRDHTERLLRLFGAGVTVEDGGGGRIVSLNGQPELAPQTLAVPGDPSSAAFPAVAAILSGDSQVTLENVGLNPLRAGLYEVLRQMGADISFANQTESAGEPVADLIVRSSSLRGVDVPPERAASMIDEYPILGIAAACASGTTRLRGIAELRVKESDRLAAMAHGLAACRVAVRETADGLEIEGNGRPPQGGAQIAADLDHRIAMAFLVLGTASADPVTIDDGRSIATSFPGFAAMMNGLGAQIAPLGASAGQ
jgi:3-phosphoshikimate 1-carboxyvinyltransferase